MVDKRNVISKKADKTMKANKNSEKTKKGRRLIATILPWILIVCGIIGTLAAGTLVYDELKLAHNPEAQLLCSLDPIVSCGSVMQSSQATAFGNLPNPIIGLVTFPALLAIGVMMLAGAVVTKRWFWRTASGVSFLAVIFCHWLFYQTVYNINNLCIYCMITWVVTFTSWLYLTAYSMEKGYISLKYSWWNKLTTFVKKHHVDIIILWALIIFVLILKHFWYYYGPKLGFN